MKFSEIHNGARLRWAPERKWLERGSGQEVTVIDARARNAEGELDRHGRYVMVGDGGSLAIRVTHVSITTLRGTWAETSRQIADYAAGQATRERSRVLADARERKRAYRLEREFRKPGRAEHATVRRSTTGRLLLAIDLDTAELALGQLTEWGWQ